MRILVTGGAGLLDSDAVLGMVCEQHGGERVTT